MSSFLAHINSMYFELLQILLWIVSFEYLSTCFMVRLFRLLSQSEAVWNESQQYLKKSPPLFLLLSVECLISLYSSCQSQFLNSFVFFKPCQFKVLAMPEDPPTSVRVILAAQHHFSMCPIRNPDRWLTCIENIVECIHFCTLINKEYRVHQNT